MTLIDGNSILVKSAFYLFSETKQVKLKDLLSILLSNILEFKQKFGDKNVYVIFDSKNSWRYEFFKYYKISRKEMKKKSKINWKELNEYLRIISHPDFFEGFPFKVLCVDGCEGDDIIAYLTKKFHDSEKIIIVSSDKDFLQLQKYSSVRQYDPKFDRWLEETDPLEYLFIHVLRGDQADAIPNILSDSDTFANKDKRQKRMTEKRINICREEIPEEYQKNYQRNKKLIDLDEIPSEIVQKIEEKYSQISKKVSRKKIFKFFVKYQMANFINIQNKFVW